MEAIEIARRMAQLGNLEEAGRAYILALHSGSLTPEEEMEAALFILQSGGDYKVAYTCLLRLYERDLFREACLAFMTEAFYEPNLKLLRSRYDKNCKALSKYPYLFRKDFLPFEELPIQFFPFDDKGHLPFYPQEQRFGPYINFDHPVISRNFFHDLENPILAKDVYSQYELEYLNDNVRKSEHIGCENHIYLHYTDWGTFCAHLQCLNVRPLLKEKKLVFLIGDQVEQYPIDFKVRFGVDYSRFPVRPIGIRDVHRLIWHTQLSTHNGGDFFNELYDAHPNLLAMPSLMFNSMEEAVTDYRESLNKIGDVRTAELLLTGLDAAVARELYLLPDRTDRDIIVAMFLSAKGYRDSVDHGARISPALFFQPHFSNIFYAIHADEQGHAVLHSKQYESIRNSGIFKAFKYIKTFTPMRRITTSHAASMRYMWEMRATPEGGGKPEGLIVPDAVADRVQNRSFMVDPEDRLYADSVLVRFEDGKLNHKATTTALTAFLDLPYTESLNSCTDKGKPVPYHGINGYAPGFSPANIYKKYEDYANSAERCYIEFLMRDAYEYYGYDFQYYDGKPLDEERIQKLIQGFATVNYYMRQSWKENVLPDARVKLNGVEVSNSQEIEKGHEAWLEKLIKNSDENRLRIAKLLMGELYFVNKNGQPLRMMPKLELDPALLEQPPYH